MMFAEKYKKAYDSIVPSEEIYCRVLSHAGAAVVADDFFSDKRETGRRRAVRKKKVGTIFAAAAVFACIFGAMPVCAANIPAFYRVIDHISPRLADCLVPIEKSSSSQGITMEVEAVDLQDDKAEIIISVRDDEDSALNRIHGAVDLFDSYDLVDYGSDMTVSGCEFLTYDEEADKAFFKIMTQTTGEYRADKLCFSVREILCNKGKESREIALSEILQSAEGKEVRISGIGGYTDEDELPDVLRRTDRTEVLDLVNAADCAADDFTVTGAAYMDGIIRLQICMGDTQHADRHVRTFLVDAHGNEKESDYSVSWQEETGGVSCTFYEYWFTGVTEPIEDYSMYGIFYNSGESVEGKWKVTFRAG